MVKRCEEEGAHDGGRFSGEGILRLAAHAAAGVSSFARGAHFLNFFGRYRF